MEKKIDGIFLKKLLKKNEKIIHNSDVQQLLEVSSATANRILVSFVKEGKLERVRDGRYWAYQKVINGSCISNAEYKQSTRKWI